MFGAGGDVIYFVWPKILIILILKLHTYVHCTCSFLHKPKKGIAFLQKNNLLGSTPGEVAQFLFTDERLDRVKCICTYVYVYVHVHVPG